jgi:hypothetical protein
MAWIDATGIQRVGYYQRFKTASNLLHTLRSPDFCSVSSQTVYHMVSQVQAEIQAIAAENDALKTSLEEQNTYAQVDVYLLASVLC